MATYVIGDIHGNLKGLKQVVSKVTDADTLIFLGDYVNKGFESFGVLEFLMQINDKFKCLFILGNHDASHLDWLLGVNIPYSVNESITQGYAKANAEVKQRHIQFLRSCKPYIRDNKNRVFVHGGFMSHKGVGFEVNETEYYCNRTLIEQALSGTHLGLQKHKEVYIGHTCTLHLNETNKPMFVKNLINVDTGSGYKYGRLTIMDIDTKKYWQSETMQELYPKYYGG